MTIFALKLILAASIICGNAAVIFVDGEKYLYLYAFLRMLSMMAVPIAAFLLVEGFYKTKNKKQYFARLFCTGLIAEIPFIWASGIGLKRLMDGMEAHLGKDIEFNSDNFNKLLEVSDVTKQYYKDLYYACGRYAIDGLLTLAVSFGMIVLIDKLRAKYFGVKQFMFVALSTLVIIGTLLVTCILPFENPIEIIFFVAVFYYLRGNKPGLSIMTLLMVLCFYTKYGVLIASGAVTAVLIIQAYKGKQGETKFKYAFYAAYPLQFIIMIGLRFLLL